MITDPVRDACFTVRRLTCCRQFIDKHSGIDCGTCPGFGLDMGEANWGLLAHAQATIATFIEEHGGTLEALVKEVTGFDMGTGQQSAGGCVVCRHVPMFSTMYPGQELFLPSDGSRRVVPIAGRCVLPNVTGSLKPYDNPIKNFGGTDLTVSVVFGDPPDTDPDVQAFIEEHQAGLLAEELQTRERQAQLDLARMVSESPEPVRRLIEMQSGRIDHLHESLKRSRKDAKGMRKLVAMAIDVLRDRKVVMALLTDRARAYGPVDALVLRMTQRLEMANRIQREAQERLEAEREQNGNPG